MSPFKPYKNQSGFQIGDEVRLSAKGRSLSGGKGKDGWTGKVTSITRSLVTVTWKHGPVELFDSLNLELAPHYPINDWVKEQAEKYLAREKAKASPPAKGKKVGKLNVVIIDRKPACGDCGLIVQYVNKPDAIYNRCPKCGKEEKCFGTEGLKVVICPKCRFGMIFKIDEENKTQYYFCCHCKFKKEKR